MNTQLTSTTPPDVVAVAVAVAAAVAEEELVGGVALLISGVFS